MQVSEWGSSGHGWPALHHLIMEDILLQRSYAPEILSAGAAKQTRGGQKLARDATQSKVRSLVCQPIIHGNTASIPSIRNSTDISVAWSQACIPSRSRDGEFASFRAILVAESQKGKVPVMAQGRCFVAKTNMRESSPPPRRADAHDRPPRNLPRRDALARATHHGRRDVAGDDATEPWCWGRSSMKIAWAG